MPHYPGETLVHVVALYLAKNLTPPDQPYHERAFYPNAEALIELIDDYRAGREVTL